jgi:hypothetical protein
MSKPSTPDGRTTPVAARRGPPEPLTVPAMRRLFLEHGYADDDGGRGRVGRCLGQMSTRPSATRPASSGGVRLDIVGDDEPTAHGAESQRNIAEPDWRKLETYGEHVAQALPGLGRSSSCALPRPPTLLPRGLGAAPAGSG